MRRTALLSVALLVAGSATGCSQIAQLQPVAGGQISAVRTATNDVLVEKDVAIAVAPVCEFADPRYTCRGTTMDAADIVAEAEVITPYGESKDEWGAYLPANVSLVVKVGDDTIYRGNVEDVLVSNGQVSP